MRRFIAVAAIAVIIAFGIGLAAGDHDHRPWHDNNAQVVTTADGSTVVVERDHGFFPFPFLIIPLLFLAFFFFAGGRRRGWNCGYGPGGDGSGVVSREEQWRQWHDSLHRNDGSGTPPGAA